jgi:hypothetical protein
VYPSCSREQREQIYAQIEKLFPVFPPEVGTGRYDLRNLALFPVEVGTVGTLSKAEAVFVPTVPGNTER